MFNVLRPARSSSLKDDFLTTFLLERRYDGIMLLGKGGR
jgi:hypothetical protein